MGTTPDNNTNRQRIIDLAADVRAKRNKPAFPGSISNSLSLKAAAEDARRTVEELRREIELTRDGRGKWEAHQATRKSQGPSGSRD